MTLLFYSGIRFIARMVETRSLRCPLQTISLNAPRKRRRNEKIKCAQESRDSERHCCDARMHNVTCNAGDVLMQETHRILAENDTFCAQKQVAKETLMCLPQSSTKRSQIALGGDKRISNKSARSVRREIARNRTLLKEITREMASGVYSGISLVQSLRLTRRYRRFIARNRTSYNAARRVSEGNAITMSSFFPMKREKYHLLIQ